MITDKATPISDTLHEMICVSDFEKKLISTPLFNRLHDIYQNSTAYLTFPCNRTKRFEHSLGTMELCSDIFYYSISNANGEILNDFFKKAEEAISQLIENLKNEAASSGANPYSDNIYVLKNGWTSLDNWLNLEFSGGIFCTRIPNSVYQLKDKKYRVLYCLLLAGVRAAALLHDVGHPPMSHVVEGALTDIYHELDGEGNKNKNKQDFMNILKEYYEYQKIELHEKIGEKIAKSILWKCIDKDNENKSKVIYELLLGKITMAILEDGDFFVDLHRIVSGTLDGDRLDYVSRDPANSGLKWGKIEYKRITSYMRLIKIEDADIFFFCPHVKSLNTVEDFLHQRWKMYKILINHHRVKKTDMLVRICIKGLAEEYFKEETDQNRIEILKAFSNLWKFFKSESHSKVFEDSVIRWDDAWLMSCLKDIYFKKISEFNTMDSNAVRPVILTQLEELITNSKRYYSLVKKGSDFEDLDKQFAVKFSDKFSKICEMYEELKGAAATYDAETQKYKKNVAFTDIESLYNNMKELTKEDDRLLLRRIDSILNERLSAIADKAIAKLKEDAPADLLDILFVPTIMKPGTDKPLYFYSAVNDKVKQMSMKECSNLPDQLATDLSKYPLFYLYALKKDGSNIEDNDKKQYIEEFINVLSDAVIQEFCSLLQRLK